MATADVIYDKVRELPEPTQREVLDFVEYLSIKHRQEDILWSEISLAAALRGLEDEDWSEYTEEDLKERWQ